MSLLENFKEECILMEKTRTDDGEGGFNPVWTEGITFSAAITYDTSLAARVAEKDGVSSTYTVTTARNLVLQYHDVFKRARDGKIFRVTTDGDDVQTPAQASFSFSQVKAEEWKLT